VQNVGRKKYGQRFPRAVGTELSTTPDFVSNTFKSFATPFCYIASIKPHRNRAKHLYPNSHPMRYGGKIPQGPYPNVMERAIT
jgi:hypothetical protein